MDKFAAVRFERDEREGQRDFLLAMNGAEIIQVSKEDVDRWYEEDTERDLPGRGDKPLHLRHADVLS